mgnify:FL=1
MSEFTGKFKLSSKCSTHIDDSCFDMVDPEDNELGISFSSSSVPKKFFLRWSVMFIERVAFRSPTAPRLVIGVPNNTVFYFSLFIIQGTQFSISRNEVLYSTVQQSLFCGDFALPTEQEERDHVRP